MVSFFSRLLGPCAASCLVAVLALGCKSGSPQANGGATTRAPAASTPAASAAAKPGVELHGDPLGPGPTTALTEILAEPEKYQGKTLKVAGQVRQVCQRKGCWMEIAVGSSPKAQGCRVTFKDYGFFVPKDSAGSKVTAQGEVRVNTVSAKDVEHYESEGATFSHKLADGSAHEVRFIASGVELSR